MDINSMLTWMTESATPTGNTNMDMIYRKMLKYRALEEGGKLMSNFITPGKSFDELSREALKLEIMNKKKSMGMDYDNTQEFEKDLNGNDRAVQGIFAGKAADVSEKISKKNPQSLQTLFKDAFAEGATPSENFLDRRYNKKSVSSGGKGLFNRIIGGKSSGYSPILRALTRH